jgi:hypothetical protein
LIEFCGKSSQQMTELMLIESHGLELHHAAHWAQCTMNWHFDPNNFIGLNPLIKWNLSSNLKSPCFAHVNPISASRRSLLTFKNILRSSQWGDLRTSFGVSGEALVFKIFVDGTIFTSSTFHTSRWCDGGAFTIARPPDFVPEPFTPPGRALPSLLQSNLSSFVITSIVFCDCWFEANQNNRCRGQWSMVGMVLIDDGYWMKFVVCRYPVQSSFEMSSGLEHFLPSGIEWLKCVFQPSQHTSSCEVQVSLPYWFALREQ